MIHTKQFLENKNKLLAQKTKVCRKCGKEKSKDLFTTHNGHADKKFPICNECKREVQRLFYKKNPHKTYETNKKWAIKNPQKRHAHVILNRAVSSGKIFKPKRCQVCGVKGRIEAHHWKGYEEEYLLDVQWLCHPCHERIDKK